MGSGALPLILLLMLFIHAALTQAISKPVLKVSPDQRVFRGERVTLTCDIQTAGGIQWRYSWFKDGYTHYPYTTTTTTTTTAVYSFTADESYSGEYSCRVETYSQRSDSWSSSDTSDAVTLTVSDSPRSILTVTPESPVFTGETVTLKCVIEPHWDWRYEWYKGRTYSSVKLQSSDGDTVNRDTLTIRGATESDQGQYWCRGQIRSVSSQSSYSVYLSVKDSPTSSLTVMRDSPVFTGETVTLKCVIESHSDWRWRNYLTSDWGYDWTPEWRYEWYKDSVKLQSSDGYTVNRDTLSIKGVNESDQGQYTCRGRRDKRPSSSQSSSAVSFTLKDLPRPTLTVTPDSPVFTGETVTLKCVIESHSDWRYEWYKDTNSSVMLQTFERYSVTRDTLTIRGVNESDQGQYWCRGRRDERPQSSQESTRIHLSVNVSAASSSSLLVTAVVLGLLCLLIFISLLLLLWRYKKNIQEDQQSNINLSSVPNQSGASQPENSPLQSGFDHIYDEVTEVKKRDKDDSESFSDITYSEIAIHKKISVDKDHSTAESNDVTYSEVRTNIKKCKRKDADSEVGDATYATVINKGR